jgi:hypothetical protein
LATHAGKLQLAARAQSSASASAPAAARKTAPGVAAPTAMAAAQILAQAAKKSAAAAAASEAKPAAAAAPAIDASKMSDEALAQAVEDGQLRFFNIEKDINDLERGVKVRRMVLEKKLGRSMADLPYQNYNCTSFLSAAALFFLDVFLFLPRAHMFYILLCVVVSSFSRVPGCRCVLRERDRLRPDPRGSGRSDHHRRQGVLRSHGHDGRSTRGVHHAWMQGVVARGRRQHGDRG